MNIVTSEGADPRPEAGRFAMTNVTVFRAKSSMMRTSMAVRRRISVPTVLSRRAAHSRVNSLSARANRTVLYERVFDKPASGFALSVHFV